LVRHLFWGGSNPWLFVCVNISCRAVEQQRLNYAYLALISFLLCCYFWWVLCNLQGERIIRLFISDS